jgi:hypothetical protein
MEIREYIVANCIIPDNHFADEIIQDAAGRDAARER